MKTIWLRKEIYTWEKISEAIKAYSSYAQIKGIEEEDYYKLFFDKCRYDEGRTIAEFENYLIGLVNR